MIAERLERRREQERLAHGVATGFRPCWDACFQKLVKSGGIMTPLTMLTLALLNLLICGVKSSVPSW